MGKWTYETKKKETIPHIFLAALGVVGLGTLLLFFALNVSSTPSIPGLNYQQFGHQAGDLGPGVFQGILTDIWDFPGIILARNAIGIGATPATLTAELQIRKSEAGANTNILVENVSATAGSSADITLTSASTSGRTFVQAAIPGQNWVMGLDGQNGGKFIIGNPGFAPSEVAISATPTGLVGIGTDSPSTPLDIVGAAHATGDICTDADGGKCLSNLHKNVAVYNGMVQKCNPSTCGAGALSVNPVDAKCDNGFVLVACGGGVAAPSGNVKTSVVTPLYASLGGGLTDGSGNPVDGCRLSWAVSAGSATGGAIAICAPKGT